MSITQYEYVLAIDELRHFGKAADFCHVTQPTLSMQVAKLEDGLGTIIFDRSKSPIIPTSEGIQIISQLKVIIREVKKLNSIVEHAKDEVLGTFKLGVIPTLSANVIPLFIKSFGENYPEVELIIEEQKTEDILRLLEDDRLDGGILVTPLHNNSIIENVLFYEEFLAFINPNNSLYKKSKLKSSDLDVSDIWLLNEGHCFRDQVLNICKSGKITKNKKRNIEFQSGNLDTLKNIVVKDGGLTLLPKLATLTLSKDEQKNLRSFSGEVPTREVSIVYARSFHKEKIINAISESIIDHLPPEIKSPKKKQIIEIF